MKSIIEQNKPHRLNANAFPKICRNCHRVYENEISFLTETTPTKTDGNIKVVHTGDTDVFLEVFRNCPCGSTLMETFHCRRDLTESGIRKRELFERVLSGLIKSGYAKNDARSLILELIKASQKIRK